mgnify:CR=1 FL=1
MNTGRMLLVLVFRLAACLNFNNYPLWDIGPFDFGIDSLRDEYYIDFTPEDESPDNFYIKMGPNFMVDKDGVLIASGAQFIGTITASAGKIGGFNIGSSSLYAGSSEAVASFTDASGKNIARAAIQARKLGINISDTASAAESLFRAETPTVPTWYFPEAKSNSSSSEI